MPMIISVWRISSSADESFFSPKCDILFLFGFFCAWIVDKCSHFRLQILCYIKVLIADFLDCLAKNNNSFTEFQWLLCRSWLVHNGSGGPVCRHGSRFVADFQFNVLCRDSVKSLKRGPIWNSARQINFPLKVSILKLFCSDEASC